MIRVLQIGLNSNPGGIENCILNYHRFINKQEFVFDYIDIYGRGLAYSDEIVSLGGKIYNLSNYKKKPLSVLRQLKQIVKFNKYDIIHINILSAANLIPILAVYKVPSVIVIHSHNSNIPSGLLRKILNNLNLKLLRNLSIEKWACSIKAGQWMWGEDFCPQNVIPNAIDTEKFSPNLYIREIIREKCGFMDSDIVVGFVGRFSEQKNVLFIPDIFVELKKRSNKFKLLLVGDGVLKKELKRKFQNLNLESDVFFSGVQMDTSVWYQAMDIFILPSLFEGLPVVGIEAQSLGIPCFISDRVTDEINITKKVNYLSIDNGAHIWAEAICTVQPYVNKSFPQEYNISFAVKKLENMYKLLLSENKK